MRFCKAMPNGQAFIANISVLVSVRKIARAISETAWGSTVMFNNFDEIINDCFTEFANPETEHNWSRRNALCERLSAQLKKTKPTVPKDFYERIRPLITSFLGAASSERTSLSKNGCVLLGHICETIGSLLHPHLDYILPKLIIVCGSTKKITQTQGNQTILTICQTAGYSPRLLHHICSSFTDKSKSIRKFAPIWLTTTLQTYQYALDADKDFPLIEKAINTGLNDSEKETREASRATYWLYAKIEKNNAFKIMEGLNPHAATALKADPNNPNKTDGPAKPARPESALSQIRAAKSKQSQAINAKRNTTPMSITSIQSDDFHFGPLDRIDAPDGSMVPLPASPPQREKMNQNHQDILEDLAVRRGWKKAPTKPESAHALAPATESSSVKSLMAAPIRRPRVVATPMSAQSHPIARPNSKGEASIKPAEPTHRSTAEKRSGRQTPTILEDKDVRAHSSTSKKSSLHMSYKSESLKTSTTRPTSSSSEPAGLKSPKRPIAQPRSVDALPLRHQKSSSASEPRAHVVIPAPVLKTMSPPHIIEGKENADVERPQKQAVSQSGDVLEKARRSLVAITEALRQGKVDALGYRKLRKLVETYPRQLFTSNEQFDEFYTLLISSMASLDEYSESRETRSRNLDHPFYNRYTIVHIAIALLDQYVDYGEPQPGMTLVALLKARGNHVDGHTHALSSIEQAAQILLRLPAICMNPNPVIDAISDALLEIEQIILHSDPITTPSTYSRPPVTAAEKAQLGTPLSIESDSSWVGPLSYTSEFGTSLPKVPDRLPTVMSFGVRILTSLILDSASFGRRLYDVQEQRLSDLAKNLLVTYKQLIKREVMAFCAALHAIIRPEERFYAFFESESDRNLIYYCVRSQAMAGEVSSVGS
jgi:CLASP N terminal